MRFLKATMMMAIMLAASTTFAQSEDGEKPKRERPQGERGGRGNFDPDQFVRAQPLFKTLDANEDGEISADEISGAVAALKKLDKDGDGKITAAEARPQFGGGEGRPGGFGGGAGRPGGDGKGMADRLMAFDKDGDGKLSSSEMPERMANMFDKLDKDGDGFVTKEEASDFKPQAREPKQQ